MGPTVFKRKHRHTLSVNLDPRLSFFFPAARVLEETKFTVHVPFNTVHVPFNTVHAVFRYYSSTVHGTRSHFIQKTKKIKNESHGTIHIFKNYFVTVFSVFSFSKNKLYPNGP